MSEYEGVQKGSLKLKGGSSISKKKKKKSKEKEKRILEQIATQSDSRKKDEDTSQPAIKVEKRTAAEMAFLRAKEKRAAETLLEKASKTHKERIMDFNQHLDQLTEHFDIPKVSWTK